MNWNEETDFISIGSGAAGLMGATIAAEHGARAMVLEGTDQLGGATAFSGALLWAPANRWQREEGVDDDIATARRYIERCLGAERAADPRWDVFLAEINGVLGWLEANTPLRFMLTGYPDSHGEWPEGRCSRHVTSHPVPLRPLGEWGERIRRVPIPGFDLLTLRDVELANAWMKPPGPAAMAKLAPRIAWRKSRGHVGMGTGLVAGLLTAALAHGVVLRIEHRVTELVSEGNRVVGVRVRTVDGERLIRATRGVLLATGGFEYDEALKAELLPGPMVAPQSPPVECSGDGIRLARGAGVKLAATDEAWYLPSIVPPGAPTYEGVVLPRPMIAERVAPHTIWVNRRGQRFVNESSQDAANSFYQRDANGALPNLPCFSILDQQFLDKYPLFRSLAADQPGESSVVVQADSLEALAVRLGIDVQGLTSTVKEFNAMVRQGADTRFQRGQGAYDRYLGDGTAAHPNLGTIEKPPFVGFEVVTSGVGTKGGAVTNRDAQAISVQGEAVAGLYAAGNASAAFNGPTTVAAGCTIPPALVMARRAALHALGRQA